MPEREILIFIAIIMVTIILTIKATIRTQPVEGCFDRTKELFLIFYRTHNSYYIDYHLGLAKD